MVENAAMRHDIARLTKSLSDEVTRLDAAEAEVALLTAENERLCEALTTKRDYVQDVATGVLVNVSPVSLVGMAKDDLERINAALQRKAGE